MCTLFRPVFWHSLYYVVIVLSTRRLESGGERCTDPNAASSVAHVADGLLVREEW